MAMTAEELFRSERRTGLGGSDAKHYLELDPYGCARLCWYEKTGVEPDHPVSGNEDLFERGHALEAIIVGKYEEKTERDVTIMRDIVRDKAHPELMAHVDGIVAPIADGDQGILECKSAGREVFFKMKREGLPLDYAAQLQHYLMVFGLRWGAFAVLWPDGWKFLTFEVEREDDLISEMRDRALELWARVKSAEAPERLDPSSKQCQTCAFWPSCQGEALLQFKGDPTSDVPVSDDPFINDLVVQFDEAREIKNEAHELAETRKDELKDALSDRTALDVPGYRVYFRTQKSWKWDTRALEKAHPELAEEFKKPSISRPLRVFAK
jgi:predicted phage-related endonuclease